MAGVQKPYPIYDQDSQNQLKYPIYDQNSCTCLYSPYKGVPPPLPLGVMHSNIFLFEVTNITVLHCNPGLIIINWLTAPHTLFSLYQVSL